MRAMRMTSFVSALTLSLALWLPSPAAAQLAPANDVGVALGHIHIGAFTNNEEFLGRVVAAGNSGGERMWHMPLDDDYKDYFLSTWPKALEKLKALAEGNAEEGVAAGEASRASR